MGILERIKDIEDEMKKTQKNKATEHHIGMLKAKLAKLRTQLLEPTSKGGKTGEGFEVTKHGHARISMIGFPSVGKSTFLSKVTKTESKAASYEFTTLTAIPGVLEYKGTNIQLLDLPGIIEGASHGKGRGRQVIATAKSSDLILMVLDAGKWEIQKELLEIELYACGIRLNKSPPNISFTVKSSGGISITNTVPLTKIDKDIVVSILKEYKIHNADVIFHCDGDVDDFIDVVEGKRAFVPCIYALNKIDHLCIEDLEELSKIPNTVVISCELGLNMDYLIQRMWDKLNLVRVYTKPIGQSPNLTESVVLRTGATVLDICRSIHKDFENEFKFALVWGRSAKFNPQRVGLSHELQDEDVIQLNKK